MASRRSFLAAIGAITSIGLVVRGHSKPKEKPAYSVPLLESDADLQLFGPTDDYNYYTDNRPHRKQLENSRRLRQAIVELNARLERLEGKV